MFSGIVEEAGRIVSIQPTPRSIGLAIAASSIGKGTRIGESIAVNGCCLTVVKMSRLRKDTLLHFDLLQETWKRTSFAESDVGSLVNLERSLRMNDRLGGHFVTGHVDGTGEVKRWEKSGKDWLLEVEPPKQLMQYLIEKGSIAIDGISLTVAEVFENTFRVWIIPHTWEVTNLRDRRLGDRVNLEADLLGKYVERLIAGREGRTPSRRPSSNKARSSARASR